MKQTSIYFLLTLGFVLAVLIPLASSAQQVDDNQQLAAEVKELTERLTNRADWWRFLRRTPFVGNQLWENLKSTAEKRKTVMLKLAEKDPAAFLQNVLPESTRERLPAELQNQIEQPVTLTTELEVLHEDDFRAKKSRTFYHLLIKESEEILNLYAVKPPPLISGSKIRIRGFRLENSAVSQGGSADIEILFSGKELIDGIGDQRKFVFFIDFPGSAPPALTREEIRDIIFSGQMQNFYREQSYDQLSFSGDISDRWIMINRPRPVSVCNSVRFGGPDSDREILEYLVAHNINLADYEGVAFVVNWPGGSRACGTVGRRNFVLPAPINGNFLLSTSWIDISERSSGSWGWRHPFPFTDLDFALAHELGHNLGLNRQGLGFSAHADGWDCGDQILYGDCRGEEYGNTFDTMGYGLSALHFSVYHKELMEWLSPQEILTIDRSGRYTINPLETSASPVKGAKIVLGGVPVFYLEYRRPIGFDRALTNLDLRSNQDGLFVNWLASAEYEDIFLLDMRPTSADWYADILTTTLNNRFLDEVRRLEIGPIVSVLPNSITFDVTFRSPVPVYGWQDLF